MANSRTKQVDEAPEVQEFDIDKKVNLRSIAPWNTGFKRISDGTGDVNIAPNGVVRISRAEIIAQVQTGNNPLISGTDGMGTHATYVIEDVPTRVELGFEWDDHKQMVFSDQVTKDLFAIKNHSEYTRQLAEKIVTRAEKSAFMDSIKKLGLNDYNKIVYAEKYTGFKLA